MTCHVCKNISTAFDPFLSISLPIVKSLSCELEWNVVLYETHTKVEEDWLIADMPVLKMRTKPGMNVKDVKAILI